MPKKDNIPDFNFADLLASVQQGVDHAVGKITAHTYQLKARSADLSAEDIIGIRKRLNVSQTVFADLLNVPKATLVAWERGLRRPSGAAVRLLQIAGSSPESLMETMSAR